MITRQLVLFLVSRLQFIPHFIRFNFFSIFSLVFFYIYIFQSVKHYAPQKQFRVFSPSVEVNLGPELENEKPTIWCCIPISVLCYACKYHRLTLFFFSIKLFKSLLNFVTHHCHISSIFIFVVSLTRTCILLVLSSKSQKTKQTRRHV